MVTDPNSPATIARADENRPPAGIQDESLTDHIIDDLIALTLVRYEPLSQQYWTDDLPDVIKHVATLVLARASTDVIVKGWPQAHGKKDFRHGLYEAAETVKEVRL